MNYVAVAYALAFTVIGGYAVSIAVRRREVERSLRAWSERPPHHSEVEQTSRGATAAEQDSGDVQ